ncbi:unnamed protein product [Allacma fusca]|uniref:Uncharacterized protein n=1 Tax=Allacma fusca TaxID=39272 RepID=A0A8J2P8K5_9HEXA|nr:unnamed protein product [Allacma fusca]
MDVVATYRLRVDIPQKGEVHARIVTAAVKAAQARIQTRRFTIVCYKNKGNSSWTSEVSSVDRELHELINGWGETIISDHREIVGAIKCDLKLELADLETATGTSWLSGFVIDVFATCLVQNGKPFGITYMPSATFWCNNGEFQFSDYVVAKFCGGFSLATESIVTVANFGNHWVILVADQNSTLVRFTDTLRGKCLTRPILQSGVTKFGEVLDRAFKRYLYTRFIWSYRFFDGVENQIMNNMTY